MMSKRFSQVLMLSVLFVATLFWASMFDFKVVNFGADAGFDTDYGSSSDYGSSDYGSSDYGSSSDYSSSSSSSGGSGELTTGEIIFAIIILIIIFTAPIWTKKLEKKQKEIEAIRKDGLSREQLEKIYQDALAKTNVTLTPVEQQQYLNKAYEVFLNTQDAWMNMDLDKLRTLLTDELYRSYENQLETLQLKGQKNIMKDFTKIHELVTGYYQMGDITTITVLLQVSFYDYIENSSGVVLRGSSDAKVYMSYELEFVINSNAMTKCPNCGGDLDGSTFCPWCRTPIQQTDSNMRMSKKRATNQVQV